MPMKLNVGLSRKVGEANYGSRGASVNFEVEIEANLVNQPDQLREKARYLFHLAKEAVEEELGGHGRQDENGQTVSGRNGNQRPTNVRPATDSQIRAMHAIADRRSIDLLRELRDRFGVETPGELSITTASQMIDELKATGNGTGGRR